MNDNSKLFAKLKELNDLKEQNLIPTELYEQKEKEVLWEVNYNNTYGSEINVTETAKQQFGGVSNAEVIVISILGLLVILVLIATRYYS